MSQMKQIKAVIVGASGYTGEEAVRLLLRHPGVEIVALTGDRKAGQPYGAVYPHLGHAGLPDLVALDDVDFSTVDVAFCCLPHGTTQKVVKDLLNRHDSLKIVDLSADFRLRDQETYAQWYGHEHYAPEFQGEAAYGLSEHNREAVKGARLVACPGCYPTSILTPLLPLVDGGLIETSDIIVDAKTGATGAGRKAAEALLFSEVDEGLKAYGIAQHRHAPEMEQELSKAAGESMTITFTPHLAPMSRGILATLYVKLSAGNSVDDLRSALKARYDDEPFVHVLDEGLAPSTHHVKGSNFCHIGVFPDRQQGRAIVVSVIDNLVKGSSGQAVQNMNLMFGFEETEGLGQHALCP